MHTGWLKAQGYTETKKEGERESSYSSFLCSLCSTRRPPGYHSEIPHSYPRPSFHEKGSIFARSLVMRWSVLLPSLPENILRCISSRDFVLVPWCENLTIDQLDLCCNHFSDKQSYFSIRWTYAAVLCMLLTHFKHVVHNDFHPYKFTVSSSCRLSHPLCTS